MIDAYLDDLLEYIEEGQVVPVIGEELLQVPHDGTVMPLYRLVALRLAEALGIGADLLPPEPTLNDVVCRHLANRGQPEEVYPKVRKIMNQARLSPPEALRQLARIDKLDLFVTLTFDSLLTTALNEVRFGGESRTLEYAYSLEDAEDLPTPRAALRAPAVFHLLGKVSAAPNYVVSEEDTLEFMHHLGSRTSARVPLLFDALEHNHLLFIGATFSDWLARFLIRIVKRRPLSVRRNETELIVASDAENDPNLARFLSYFSPRTRLIQLPPAEFVAALAARYLGPAPSAAAGRAGAAREALEQPVPGSIFLSYAHEDYDAAERIRHFLDENGIDVWLDRSKLKGGQYFDDEIRRSIKNCDYFIPVISATAVGRRDGYFRREWRYAEDRALNRSDEFPFIIPVAIDGTPESSRGLPDSFARQHWTRLPEGLGTDEFRSRVTDLVRNYRRGSRA